MKPGAKLLVFVFATLLFFSLSNIVSGYREGGGDEYEGGAAGGDEYGRGDREIFILPKAKQVMRSEAGEFRVAKGFMHKGGQSPMHIGFINMEPRSLFLPQYLDSTLILFIRRGRAKIGWIYKDGLVEKNLRIGDVYQIPAGSSFYIVNTGEGQILQMICSIDTSESLQMGAFQSFFIGGGMSPVSVLAGFDQTTLTTAFNVSSSQLGYILSRQQGGPMVFVNGSAHDSRTWNSMLKLKHKESLHYIEDLEDNELWTWRKLLTSLIGTKKTKTAEAYNLYDRSPDFENSYGSSRAISHHDYSALGKTPDAGIGVYLVNLTAGAMMAPHVNPTATEYGIVLKGTGRVQIVYPNGSSAMNAELNEGDVFWIPRYFPFCQIASREGPFVFFGFTTSARENRPQFLAGASSILQTMRGAELASAFGVSQDKFDRLINAQRESIILPSAHAAPPKLRPEPEHKEQDAGGRRSRDPVIELWE